MASGPGFFSSSIGKKYLIGLTGIFVSLFVFTHMLGNMLLFVGPEAYNRYSHKLITMPGIVLVELILAAIFLTHVLYTFGLTLQNQAARGNRYALTTSGAKAVTLASKTMIWHGSLILVFVVFHLVTVKYGKVIEADYNGVVMRDLYQLMLEHFKQPAYTAFYSISVLLLGFHLSHGVQSIFQSLGFNHPAYTPKIKVFGVAYGVVIGLGYLAQPIFFYFFQ